MHNRLRRRSGGDRLARGPGWASGGERSNAVEEADFSGVCGSGRWNSTSKHNQTSLCSGVRGLINSPSRPQNQLRNGWAVRWWNQGIIRQRLHLRLDSRFLQLAMIWASQGVSCHVICVLNLSRMHSFTKELCEPAKVLLGVPEPMLEHPLYDMCFTTLAHPWMLKTGPFEDAPFIPLNITT